MNVRLRRLQSKDSKGMLEWMHAMEMTRYFRKDMLTKTEKDVLEFIEQADIIPSNGKSVHYAVVEKSDEYLGTISLKSINMDDRNAEYAIGLRKAAQGRGVGYAATKEMLNIAFNKLGLEKVYLNVLSENKRAIRLYEKCGFVLEGEFRNHLYMREQYQNLRWYAMLKKEYRSSEYMCGGDRYLIAYTYSLLKQYAERRRLYKCVFV